MIKQQRTLQRASLVQRAAAATALAVTSVLIAGATSPAAAAPAGVDELPPIVYVGQGFNDLAWVTDRTEPVVFDAQADTLTIAVDRENARGTAYAQTEGKVAPLPHQASVAGSSRDIVSVAADIYIDPAWEGLPTSPGRDGIARSFSMEMWLDVLYHPAYPGANAWPMVQISDDGSGNPVATVVDTTNRVPAASMPTVPVAFGSTVTLEIRYNAADYSYYYFVDDTLIFSHQWWNEDGYGHPFNHLYFQAWNTGQPDDGTATNPVSAQWSNLRFGVLAPPAAVITEELPHGYADVPWGPVTLDINSEVEYTTTVSEGALPPGLTLGAGGELSGTPTTPGTYAFTVFANNGAELDDEITSLREFTIVIDEAVFGGDYAFDYLLSDDDPYLVGKTVSVTLSGVAEPSPQDISYQWFCDGSPIPGATDVDYTFMSEDVDCVIHVEVTMFGEGFTETVVLDAIGPILPLDLDEDSDEDADEETDSHGSGTGTLPKTGAAHSWGVAVSGFAMLMLGAVLLRRRLL